MSRGGNIGLDDNKQVVRDAVRVGVMGNAVSLSRFVHVLTVTKVS